MVDEADLVGQSGSVAIQVKAMAEMLMSTEANGWRGIEYGTYSEERRAHPGHMGTRSSTKQ